MKNKSFNLNVLCLTSIPQIRFFLFLVIGVLFTTNIHAQKVQVYVDTATKIPNVYSITSKSDYKVKVVIKNFSVHEFFCKNNLITVTTLDKPYFYKFLVFDMDTDKFTYGKGSIFHKPNQWWDVDSSRKQFEIVTGPSCNGNLVNQFFYSGNSCYSGSTIVNPQPPGCLCGKPATDSTMSISVYQNLKTADIKPPKNVYATNDTSDSYIDLKWDKGTDIPNNLVRYNIYRNDTLIGFVNESDTTVRHFRFRDTGALVDTPKKIHSGLLSGQRYKYTVTTYTDKFGTTPFESSKIGSDTGTTFSAALEAGDNVYTTKTVLKWKDMSNLADEVEVARLEYDSSGWTQLAVLSKFANTYSDIDGIPGIPYLYKVLPRKKGEKFREYYDFGTRKENGIISGKVLSPQNAGVADVWVYVSDTVNYLGAKRIVKDSVLTDNTGYYEIKGIFYYDSAVLNIYPYKLRHGFKTPLIRRTLDLSNFKQTGVDFIDTSVFSVIGKVRYQVRGAASTDTCGISDVAILLNGHEINRTDATGRYAFSIRDEGTYTIAPKLTYHHFNKASETLLIKKDTLGLNFYDIETAELALKVIGGCEHSIADSADVRILSTKGNFCYDTTIRTNSKGDAKITLAAREYKILVTNIYDKNPNSNIFAQIGNKPKIINLAVRDSSTEKRTIYKTDTIPERIYYDSINNRRDTVKAQYKTTSHYDSSKIPVAPKVEFIYISPLKIEVNFEEVAEKMVCVPDNSTTSKTSIVPLLEKGTSYTLDIEVYEEQYHCPVKEGKLRIYDDPGDIKIPSELVLKNGKANYILHAGGPNIASSGLHPYQKLFYLAADVGFLDPKYFNQWVLVTGARARDKTFITRTPATPFIILHDPPGDQSYAFIEKGTTITKSLDFQTSENIEGGKQDDVTLGAGFHVGVGTEFEAHLGLAVESTLKAGKDELNRDTKDISFTFKERFSTKDAQDVLGYAGDVYVGAAFNLLYALSDVVMYDEGNCNIKTDINIVMDPIGFATTFIYTEEFIKVSIIPRLEEIVKIVEKEKPDSAQRLKMDIATWKNILEIDSLNRDSRAVKLPGEKGNISISYGAEYDAEFEYDSSTTASYESSIFISEDVFIGARFDYLQGFWTEGKTGVVTGFKTTTTTSTSQAKQNKTTYGYHLNDDDYGDYHSIDILNDTAYGVPAFRLVSGATSCPNEPNTQRRDLAKLFLDPPVRDNVPIGKPAVFSLNVVNLSMSDEIRDYIIMALPEDNPDGAIIKIAGQNINFTPAKIRLKPRQTTRLELTIERGSLANQYKRLRILVIAPCEVDLWRNNSSDTIDIDVSFQNECSPVTIYNPVNNWVQNATQGDNLNIALTGYDANEADLKSLKLEYRSPGMGWIEALEIPKDNLIDKFYDVKFNTKIITDGNYELRASAICQDKDGNINSINYSEIVPGKIDRKSASLFGTPSPSNQILNFGQDISVEFDKDIDNSKSYYPGKIALQRMDNKKYLPLTYTVSGNKMIIKPNPVSLLDSLEGILLKATVLQIKDLSGNMTVEPIEWEFVVNRSPVYWETNTLNISFEKGKTGKSTGKLKNSGAKTGSFTLTKYPIWLSPDILSGNINSGSNQDIVFTVTSGLNPGIYSDTVIAMSGAYKLKLYVKVEVLTPQPRWVKQVLDPSKYEHSMNFIAQFSTNTTDSPLSTDTKDAIGVFVNDSLRGKGYITYDQQLRKYFALITVYSNNNTNDSLSFRMWDAYPGIQYHALESKLFKNDALIGQFNSPFILHPKGLYQTINMNKGWNWFGLFVKNNNQTPDGIFGKAAKDSMTIVKTRDNYSQYNGGSWYGNIDTIRAGIGYMIKVPKADTVEIYGSSYGSELITPIEGNNNWSWVGNADLFGSAVKNKLINLNATTNDVIKSQTEFAVFDGTNWTGNLGYIEPGAGYKIRTTVPGEFKTQKLYKTLPGWNLNFSGMEHNMNITAELFKGTKRIFDSHYLIGAFINGKCQGVAQPVFSDKLNRYVVYLTVLGDDAQIGSPVTLKLFDTDLGAEIPQTSGSITFTPDGVNGTVSDPFDLVINAAEVDKITKSKTSLICYPNPFDSQIHVDLSLPKKDNVEIYITDALGRKIETLQNGTLSPGNHTWLWDGNKSPQGIYFCITTINGEVIRTTIMKK